MIRAAKDAELSLEAAKWEEARCKVEDERDELAARGRHQLNQIKELRWVGGWVAGGGGLQGGCSIGAVLAQLCQCVQGMRQVLGAAHLSVCTDGSCGQ
jgi:hypothetical protein